MFQVIHKCMYYLLCTTESTEPGFTAFVRFAKQETVTYFLMYMVVIQGICLCTSV